MEAAVTNENMVPLVSNLKKISSYAIAIINCKTNCSKIMFIKRYRLSIIKSYYWFFKIK